MQIYEFLKVKKVKCIDVSGMCLSKDKEYQLLGVTDKSCIINDDDGYEVFASIERFEPVLDNINMGELVKHLTVGKNWKEIGCDHIVTITEISSEFANSTMVAFESDCCLSSSPLEMFLKDFEPVLDNDMSKSDTKIDISENSVDVAQDNQPIFKVGDKVYVGLTGRVAQVTEIVDDDVISVANKHNEVRAWVSNICHATQENYEMLLKLYPYIEFELPPKEITGSDLCRAMLEKWWLYVPCYTSNDSEQACVTSGVIRFIKTVSVVDGTFINNHNHSYKYAVPFDVKTGIPLTEGVLNDIN